MLSHGSWTCEKELARLPTTGLEVGVNGLACVLGQFKANGPTGLSLTHRRSINCVTIRRNVIDFNRDDVAAAQLTIDGKIEHC
jgi:hypothetical protein